ncbi:MAG: hypothetical protein KKF46_05460 [Nanoarchaeota archaeon]|nr:hypothetical protein [Nanoarchaeota archaeon]MBU1321780.1 hypothetical protein [Nanoarchaeota archaeon]MBU1598479.1 hypothetical protein [Nanoarchaeota archaeon]MBU2440813.1 hypothetical protein [Nanoarchaeota archaeon]
MDIRPIENWNDYLNYCSLTPPKNYSKPNPIDYLVANIAKKTPLTAKAKRAVLKTIYDNLNIKGGKAPIDEAPDKNVHAAFQRVFLGKDKKINYDRIKNQLRQLKRKDSPIQKQIDFYRKNLAYQIENTALEQINLPDLVSTDVIFGHELPFPKSMEIRDTIEQKIEQSSKNDVTELRKTFGDPVMLQYAATHQYK